jgi:O-antigen ligase
MTGEARRADELSGGSRERQSSRFAAVTIVLLLAWGTFAFGAVYPWAYRPLMSGAAITGLFCLVRFRSVAGVQRLPALAFAAVVAAILLQTVPLPSVARHAVSPAHAALVSQLDFGMLVAPDAWRPLTIDRGRTLTAAACAAALFLLTLGASRWLTVYGARRFAAHLAVVGLVLAVVGVAQRPLFGTRIYGFWEPLMLRRPYEPFGPFVLENHFGGWMLLALPVVLARVCAGIAREMPAGSWHARVAWLGSAGAQQVWLLAVAAAAMSVSLLLTFSRSAIGAFVLAVILTGVFAVRGTTSFRRRLASLAIVATIGWGALVWVGLDRIVTFFRNAPWESLNVRLGPWQDAWRVINDFWLTGTGMNTYAQSMIMYQRFGVEWAHYSQAHNDYLQLLAEGGLLVALPAIAAVLALAIEIRRQFARTERGSTTWWLRCGAVTGLVAIAVQETVEFSLQMPGNAVLCALVLALAIHRPSPRRALASRGT